MKAKKKIAIAAPRVRRPAPGLPLATAGPAGQRISDDDDTLIECSLQMALAATSIGHIGCSVARLQPLLCVVLAMQITQNAELSKKTQTFLPKC